METAKHSYDAHVLLILQVGRALRVNESRRSKNDGVGTEDEVVLDIIQSKIMFPNNDPFRPFMMMTVFVYVCAVNICMQTSCWFVILAPSLVERPALLDRCLHPTRVPLKRLLRRPPVLIATNATKPTYPCRRQQQKTKGRAAAAVAA